MFISVSFFSTSTTPIYAANFPCSLLENTCGSLSLFLMVTNGCASAASDVGSTHHVRLPLLLWSKSTHCALLLVSLGHFPMAPRAPQRQGCGICPSVTTPVPVLCLACSGHPGVCQISSGQITVPTCSPGTLLFTKSSSVLTSLQGHHFRCFGSAGTSITPFHLLLLMERQESLP